MKRVSHACPYCYDDSSVSQVFRAVWCIDKQDWVPIMLEPTIVCECVNGGTIKPLIVPLIEVPAFFR